MAPPFWRPFAAGIPHAFFSLLYPDDCRVCAAPLVRFSRAPVCDDCLGGLKPLASRAQCIQCGLPFENDDAAIAHVNRYGSGHTEAIVTTDLEAARRFTREVDAAAVIVNASTRFTDGEEFGFGAEIGISTQKLHARGPMGLRELTTYKYVVWGDGQVRS